MINEFYRYKFIIIIMVNNVNKAPKKLKTEHLECLASRE